jgi:molybdopterin/thiamine biosynthesis adenylyltransferase
MIELVIGADDMANLRSELFRNGDEHCAVAYTSQVQRGDGLMRLLVREIEYPSEADYLSKGPREAALNPALVARVTKRARNSGDGLVFVHNHFGPGAAIFSTVDDRGESHLQEFLSRRYPESINCALLVTADFVACRELGTNNGVRVVELGAIRNVLYAPEAPRQTPPRQAYDRQIRAFGRAGQRTLETVRVSIVGLGGTGSIIAQELAHLGVQDYHLIDPDVLDESNLNRVVGTSPSDVGTPKADLIARSIRAVLPTALVTTTIGDVVDEHTARTLLDADIIFGCTDSHGSRAVLQQIAYQFLIPCIDLGVTITTEDDTTAKIYGRVQLLSPGIACFACSRLLDPEQVRRDMLTGYERKADPYVQGAHEPAPAVISLNGTVASLAVTMFLSVVAHIPMAGRHLLYNAIESKLRIVLVPQQSDCYICSKRGALARGNSWPLFARRSAG